MVEGRRRRPGSHHRRLRFGRLGGRCPGRSWRWTRRRKATITSSRVDTIKAIVDAMAPPPRRSPSPEPRGRLRHRRIPGNTTRRRSVAVDRGEPGGRRVPCSRLQGARRPKLAGRRGSVSGSLGSARATSWRVTPTSCGSWHCRCDCSSAVDSAAVSNGSAGSISTTAWPCSGRDRRRRRRSQCGEPGCLPPDRLRPSHRAPSSPADLVSRPGMAREARARRTGGIAARFAPRRTGSRAGLGYDFRYRTIDEAFDEVLGCG